MAWLKGEVLGGVANGLEGLRYLRPVLQRSGA